MSIRQALPALLLVFLAGCSSLPTTSPPRVEPSALAAQSVPVEVLNTDVTQDTIQKTVCVPGYTATVRPSTSFTKGVKVKLLREQGSDVCCT